MISCPRTCSRGVTLLELIVVVTILGIMLSVMTPLFRDSFTSLEAQNAYKNVAALFRHAQERAIMEEREFRLNLERLEGAYWLTYRDNPMKFPAEFVDLNTDAGRVRWLPETVRISLVDNAKYDRKTRARYITFYPNGSADRVTVQLRGTAGGSFRIETGRDTGIVTIKER
jgi:prepilin-type N-terminal cleavage/methylation domain-containing protein